MKRKKQQREEVLKGLRQANEARRRRLELWTTGEISEPQEFETLFDTEPIVGWRMWRVAKATSNLTAEGLVEVLLASELEQWPTRLKELQGYRLGSYSSHDSCWVGAARAEAACAHHEAPERNCGCGFWAFKDKQGAEQLAGTSFTALGEAYLWGKVIETKKGYRARYAYPKSLTLYGVSEEIAEEIRSAYRVPVGSKEALDAGGIIPRFYPLNVSSGNWFTSSVTWKSV